MESDGAQLVEVKPPGEMSPVRLDASGRMKLPPVFKQYLDLFPEKRLWITSLDRAIGQIYPIPVWEETQKFLDSHSEDPDLAERLAFNASDLGSEATPDSQGRLVIHERLRRELGIEDQTVRLKVFRGYIQILSERIYEEQLATSKATARDDVRKAAKAGMGKMDKILVPKPAPATS